MPFARPTETHLNAEKEPVEGSCPECGAAELRRYPVMSEGGWFEVVKCQGCLHSVSREPWHLLGHIHMLSDSI